MRNDLTGDPHDMSYSTLADQVNDLRAEIHDLRGVVDPLMALIFPNGGLFISRDDKWRAERRHVCVTTGDTLAEALSALLAALKPPEPKWTVECPGVVGLDQSCGGEQGAMVRAREKSMAYPEQGVIAKRDGQLVAVFVGGVRCNPETKT